MVRKAIAEIIKYGKLAGSKDFTPGISGNISVKTGNKIVITGTGTANGYLDKKDFAVLDSDGNQIGGKTKASSEKLLHLSFYRHRDDIGAIIHVHSPYLTAFASAGVELNQYILPEIIFLFERIPLAPYGLPGTEELVGNSEKFFNDYDVILLENHGVVVGGKDLKDAFLKLELCEAYAKTIICAKILGGAKILSDENVKKIMELKH